MWRPWGRRGTRHKGQAGQVDAVAKSKSKDDRREEAAGERRALDAERPVRGGTEGGEGEGIRGGAAEIDRSPLKCQRSAGVFIEARESERTGAHLGERAVAARKNVTAEDGGEIVAADGQQLIWPDVDVANALYRTCRDLIVAIGADGTRKIDRAGGVADDEACGATVTMSLKENGAISSGKRLDRSTTRAACILEREDTARTELDQSGPARNGLDARALQGDRG